jgi:dGTPase
MTLAAYACLPEHSRGRLFAEPESSTRSPFQRDRDRIVHSAAFRRLKYKTQVFVNHEGDHFRTRLTHSLEVAQIARSLARTLQLNEDLAEALALAHDLGHPPFGHTGEEALDERMQAFGGFDHNAQTLRIVTRLEHRYADFDGLNLTWETLEGVVKHNGPILGPLARRKRPVPASILDYSERHDLELERFAGLEAQVASLADDIAYINHDLDDGLRAGLFPLDDLRPLPLIGPAIQEVERRYPGLETTRMAHESIRRVIDRMVNDLLAETGKRVAEARPATADDLRGYTQPLAAFSDPMQRDIAALREFQFARMYRHFRVNRTCSKARRVIADLVDLFMREPECLPTEWRQAAGEAQSESCALTVLDYVAGMTDRYAFEEHRRLFDLYARG